MRFFEISSGLRIPVSEEEQEILDLISPENRIAKSKLDERQKEVARNMVTRGLLVREREDDVTFLRTNSAADIWRF
jgi:ParB-like chromosome segregation protein Spo0J